MALVGLAVIWLRLRAIKKTVEHLAQTHGSATGSQAVEVKGLSLPSGAFSDAITPTELVEERLIILGYRTLVITLDNQSNGDAVLTKDISIEIPTGTVRVLASLVGFSLVFGKATGSSLDSLSIEDHHLGAEAVAVEAFVVGSGTAILRVYALLRDKNGDDKWTGSVYASVIFMGDQS